MNKKHTFKKTAALLLGLALTVGATGCNFIVTDSEADLKQIVARVDVTATLEADKNSEYQAFAKQLDKIIAEGGMTTSIPKRDLVAYFLSVGATYVQNYGYTYKDTVNMLMDGLVNRKIMAQYAVAYYLKNGEDAEGKALTADGCLQYVQDGIDAATGKEKDLLKAHRDVLSMKYFLTENGNDDKEYNAAVYGLMSSLNSSLDSAESGYITAEEHTHTHSETRTTPTNVNTAKSDYVPMDGAEIDYDIYTGRNTIDSCGAYQDNKVDGSTATTRKKAYNAFLSNLQSYGLIKENEDTKDIKQLDYYYLELSSSLEQALINKFYEDMKEDAIAALSKDEYKYVSEKYEEIKAAQQYAYEKDPSSFSTTLDGVSDDSFVLYGEKDFGFIYNILLPFSASQEMEYAAAKNKGGTEEDNYKARREILDKIQAKDLRSAWFCEEDSAENYSYEASGDYYNNGAEKGDKTYLFFEEQTGANKNAGKYESLGQYAGLYPYNGKATYVDGEWEFKANPVTINGFLGEMEGYINYMLGADANNPLAKGDTIDAYYDDNKETGKEFLKDGKIDYSKFLYYEGKVTLENTARKDFFYAGTEEKKNDSYLALSAVNELMFAYSTDTGCLNTYMGYVVSPYKTDFVSEFEYAAQYAVKKGVGTYVVAPSDYGWHIIYVAFVYDADDGDVYGGFNKDEIEMEGTFSNLFYESLKATTATNYTTEVENTVLNAYKGSATRFVKAYQDLLDLDEA